VLRTKINFDGQSRSETEMTKLVSEQFSLRTTAVESLVFFTLEQRCPAHLQIATCGEWQFKCGEETFFNF